MTNHLEWHQHAFIDENNIVINVAVFEEWAHNHQLLQDIKDNYNAKDIICCCQYGLAGVGYEWTGSEFRYPKPYPSWIWDNSIKRWMAPVPMPEDNVYSWNESTLSWDEISF